MSTENQSLHALINKAIIAAPEDAKFVLIRTLADVCMEGGPHEAIRQNLSTDQFLGLILSQVAAHGVKFYERELQKETLSQDFTDGELAKTEGLVKSIIDKAKQGGG